MDMVVLDKCPGTVYFVYRGVVYMYERDALRQRQADKSAGLDVPAVEVKLARSE